MNSTLRQPPRDVIEALGDVGLNGVIHSAATAHALPAVPGAYVLVLGLAQPVTITLKGRRPHDLDGGWYLYCGSARGSGGLRARLGRHLRGPGRPHWHVDQLTPVAMTWGLAVPDGRECDLVAKLLEHSAFDSAVPGFGNSDCHRCTSHLLRAARAASPPCPRPSA